jgi:hypothetical protein
MRYSVWNQVAREYDYYEAPTVQKSANTPVPSHIRAKPLGATIDQAAWPLPSTAKLIGRGKLAEGRIASKGGGLMTLGAFGMDTNTIGMIGFGFAAFMLWRSGFLKT